MDWEKPAHCPSIKTKVWLRGLGNKTEMNKASLGRLLTGSNTSWYLPTWLFMCVTAARLLGGQAAYSNFILSGPPPCQRHQQLRKMDVVVRAVSAHSENKSFVTASRVCACSNIQEAERTTPITWSREGVWRRESWALLKAFTYICVFWHRVMSCLWDLYLPMVAISRVISRWLVSGHSQIISRPWFSFSVLTWPAVLPWYSQFNRWEVSRDHSFSLPFHPLSCDDMHIAEIRVAVLLLVLCPKPNYEAVQIVDGLFSPKTRPRHCGVVAAVVFRQWSVWSGVKLATASSVSFDHRFPAPGSFPTQTAVPPSSRRPCRVSKGVSSICRSRPRDCLSLFPVAIESCWETARPRSFLGRESCELEVFQQFPRLHSLRHNSW